MRSRIIARMIATSLGGFRINQIKSIFTAKLIVDLKLVARLSIINSWVTRLRVEAEL